MTSAWHVTVHSNILANTCSWLPPGKWQYIPTVLPTPAHDFRLARDSTFQQSCQHLLMTSAWEVAVHSNSLANLLLNTWGRNMSTFWRAERMSIKWHQGVWPKLIDAKQICYNQVKKEALFEELPSFVFSSRPWIAETYRNKKKCFE